MATRRTSAASVSKSSVRYVEKEQASAWLNFSVPNASGVNKSVGGIPLYASNKVHNSIIEFIQGGGDTTKVLNKLKLSLNVMSEEEADISF